MALLSAMFSRIETAHTNFEDYLMEQANISRDDAKAVTAFYLKKKLAKVDAGIGRINVKHGGFLDPEVIRKALEEAKKAD